MFRRYGINVPEMPLEPDDVNAPENTTPNWRVCSECDDWFDSKEGFYQLGGNYYCPRCVRNAYDVD